MPLLRIDQDFYDPGGHSHTVLDIPLKMVAGFAKRIHGSFGKSNGTGDGLHLPELVPCRRSALYICF